MAASVPQRSANDLWADAAKQLSDDDKQHINFSRSDKRNILAELHADAEKLRQRSVESRWKYTRKSGETVIIRDVFEKIVRWVDTFKQIGDVAVQYDPAHAALPWAGIRFLLQVTVNDSHRLALLIEGLARIAELICRYAVTEALYVEGASKPDEGLERAIVKLYASILIYLSKARQYFEQGTAKRIIKSAVPVETPLDSGLDGIHIAEQNVNQWLGLANRDDSVRNHKELIRLLTSMDEPLRRMDDNLKNIQDDLQASRRSEIVRWLSPEPYKQHHKQAMQGVLPGTGRWLLSDPDFKKWKDESASSILWLHGTQGSGKSKLISIVIEDALKSFKDGNNPPPVFFYCSRNPAEPTRSDPKAILASLARQLSSLEPGKPLLQPSINLYSKEEAEGFASGHLQVEESCGLIMQLIGLYPQTTVIIDAMDECDPTTRLDLLRALERILQQSPSLVKVFVSSRDDQDIALELSGYPNLVINSQRNSDDIAQFVKAEVERLIQAKKLLRYSANQTEMKNMIIDKVIEGATGMFRWASMQLQYLCSFRLDKDIQDSLGQLPPDLHTLYSEIYDVLSKTSGELEAMVFKNVLHWLLCAKRALQADEFLAIVSIDTKRGNSTGPIYKDFVLDICNNFVIFDSQLGIFRFAHLSVQEFLEKRPEYDRLATNRLIAEVCLWSVLPTPGDLAIEKLFLGLGWCANPEPTRSELLRRYADIYWPIHCKSAGSERKSGTLRRLLQHILCNDEATSSLVRWGHRLQKHSKENVDWKVQRQLDDTMTTPESVSSLGLFLCCIFDFEEYIEDILGGKTPVLHCFNIHGRSCLQIAARNGSCATLDRLIAKLGPETKLPAEVVEAAAENRDNGKEMMALLLDRRGADIVITEEVVKAAADNFVNGNEVIALLLDQQGADVVVTKEMVVKIVRNFNQNVVALLLDWQGADVVITEEVVKAAAGNHHNGKEVMSLLLDQRGADVVVTEEVVKAAAGNFYNGKEVMLLLLNQRGADVVITEGVVEAAADNPINGKEVMLLLLDRRGADVVITEEVVEAAAGNPVNGKE
ncbi:hypothetical protein K505DRAFT_415804, partial [Melanomma pulvis-pyrius CBS 109.77]